MPLANIERSFVGSLLQPQEHDFEFLSELLPLGTLNEERQLSIYRSNVNGAHQKVLGQIYPACLNILGEDYFNHLCRAYRFEHPSTDSDLNNYGEYFSVFIKEQFEIHNELDGFEYLADLAWFEWCWHASYYAKDDDIFSFDKLALVDTEKQDKLIFTLGYSFSLHSTLYPVLNIWDANKNTGEESQEFYMPEEKSYFCVSRVDFSPVVELLDSSQYELLKFISNTASLMQLSELYEKHDDDFQNQLMYFIQKGWISGFYLRD